MRAIQRLVPVHCVDSSLPFRVEIHYLKWNFKYELSENRSLCLVNPMKIRKLSENLFMHRFGKQNSFSALEKTISHYTNIAVYFLILTFTKFFNSSILHKSS